MALATIFMFVITWFFETFHALAGTRASREAAMVVALVADFYSCVTVLSKPRASILRIGHLLEEETL